MRELSSEVSVIWIVFEVFPVIFKELTDAPLRVAGNELECGFFRLDPNPLNLFDRQVSIQQVSSKSYPLAALVLEDSREVLQRVIAPKVFGQCRR